MGLVRHQQGNAGIALIGLMPFFVACLILVAKLTVFDARQGKKQIQVDDAARLGAAIITTSGEENALALAISHISEYADASVEAFACGNSTCIRATFSYQNLLDWPSLMTTVTATAKAYDTPEEPNTPKKIGAYLVE